MTKMQLPMKHIHDYYIYLFTITYLLTNLLIYYNYKNVHFIRVTQGQTTTYTDMLYGQFSFQFTGNNIFGLREVAGEPGKNPAESRFHSAFYSTNSMQKALKPGKMYFTMFISAV